MPSDRDCQERLNLSRIASPATFTREDAGTMFSFCSVHIELGEGSRLVRNMQIPILTIALIIEATTMPIAAPPAVDHCATRATHYAATMCISNDKSAVRPQTIDQAIRQAQAAKVPDDMRSMGDGSQPLLAEGPTAEVGDGSSNPRSSSSRAAAIGNPTGSLGCYKSIWKPTEQDVAKAFASEKRVHYANAPDGSPAVQFTAMAKQPNEIAQFMSPLPGFKVEAARATVDMYLEKGYEYNPRGGGKFALGLWGGEKGCLSGGCPPGRQTGFSVRLTHGMGSKQTYPAIYSYNLNRSDETDDSVYGQKGALLDASGERMRIPTGVWVTYVMDLVLNTPGRSDGWVQIDMSIDGKMVATRTMTDLVFRESPDWFIRGPILTEMWGGDINRSANFPPKTQRSWYRRFEVLVPSGVASDCDTKPR
jgi:hypothetical protein